MSISPKISDPINITNNTLSDAIKDNVKNLILTAPGEKITDPVFGVGLKRYLFEPDTEELRSTIENNIYKAMGNYLPYVNINKIVFSPPGSNNENILYVQIHYSISGTNINDEIIITT
jgi:phage baseplate assembly protein W